MVDASILVNAVGDDEAAGQAARGLLRLHEALAAPDLIDVETTNVLRRRWLAGSVSVERFESAVLDLAAMPLDRFPTRRLMIRAFELRENVSAYDSCYVALAEGLDCPLWTTDARLARASGPRCAMRVLHGDNS